MDDLGLRTRGPGPHKQSVTIMFHVNFLGVSKRKILGHRQEIP